METNLLDTRRHGTGTRADNLEGRLIQFSIDIVKLAGDLTSKLPGKTHRRPAVALRHSSRTKLRWSVRSRKPRADICLGNASSARSRADAGIRTRWDQL